jgi:hypothetical protein
LLLTVLAALAAGGCGAAKTQTSAELRLEREDLVAVTRGLSDVEPAVRAEVASTKAAWPLVVNGLPAATSTLAHPVRVAAETADKLKVPTLFAEGTANALTGPGSGLASSFRGSARLTTRGWRMIGAAIAEIEHGSPAAARFARANVALYIESVYDAHFSLAQLGKQLLAAYKKLGGPSAFGSSLSQQEIDELADSYSEANDRLHPHVAVKLGS